MSEVADEDAMTASYTEISRERPDQLDLILGESFTTTRDGGLVTWVAADLESKLRLSSPLAAADSPQGVLTALESEASALAASVDSLTETLSETLHGISALTVDCLEVYRDVVIKACDSIDSNIKSMYQLMAKCEELSKAMAPLHKLSAHIKNIKHLLDLLESNSS